VALEHPAGTVHEAGFPLRYVRASSVFVPATHGPEVLIVSEDEWVTTAPVGATPVAVAALLMLPRSMSAKVVVYLAAHISETSGLSVEVGQVTADRPGLESVTPTECSLTLPVLATR
jgi:hypothetical protein